MVFQTDFVPVDEQDGKTSPIGLRSPTEVKIPGGNVCASNSVILISNCEDQHHRNYGMVLYCDGQELVGISAPGYPNQKINRRALLVIARLEKGCSNNEQDSHALPPGVNSVTGLRVNISSS